MLTVEDVENRIKEHLPKAAVKARDLTGGGDHWQVAVVAEEFSGLSLIEQHQRVYAALGAWMKKEIHALSLDTRSE